MQPKVGFWNHIGPVWTSDSSYKKKKKKKKKRSFPPVLSIKAIFNVELGVDKDSKNPRETLFGGCVPHWFPKSRV